jgi:hypothetical protein
MREEHLLTHLSGTLGDKQDDWEQLYNDFKSQRDERKI